MSARREKGSKFLLISQSSAFRGRALFFSYLQKKNPKKEIDFLSSSIFLFSFFFLYSLFHYYCYYDYKE